MKAGRDPVHEKLRAICMQLPDAAETVTWGHPNWRVGGPAGKIFCGYGADETGASMSFKADPMLRDGLLQDGRFTVAAYVGKYGWLSLDMAGKLDWGEIAQLVGTSHALIAAGAPRKKSAPRKKK
jgi:predicted DNA-binding protein (MmcQ/YjbR family)